MPFRVCFSLFPFHYPKGWDILLVCLPCYLQGYLGFLPFTFVHAELETC